jgi:thymidylate synthase (FAD)
MEDNDLIKMDRGYPSIPSAVRLTRSGTPYLQAPGLALLAKPTLNMQGMQDFLDGFGPEAGFSAYLADPPGDLHKGELLCKIAGQLCYLSLGERCTKNAEAQRYFDHIKASGHGSVLEHANYTFLFYGISRSQTHEIVRHRAGYAFSQVSQRYVDGSRLRFVERPEYQDDLALHRAFEDRIDRLAQEYRRIGDRLLEKQQAGDSLLSAEARTDARKKVNQAARSVLPNETEAPLVMTANVRAWRHFIEMRAHPAAEVEIRALAFRAYLCLKAVAPLLFSDYRVARLPDGTYSVETAWRKV